MIRRSHWQLRLVDGLYAVDVSPPPECTTMVHLRGEIEPGMPAFGVVATRDAGSDSLHALALRLATSYREVPEPRPFAVVGSTESYRLDGTIDMGEGLTEDGIERIATIVALRHGRIASLTLRTRPADAVAETIERIAGSFELIGPDPGALPDEA